MGVSNYRHVVRRNTITNPSVQIGQEVSADDISPNGSNTGSDWNRRAGPVFRYGLATGFVLILLGGMSMNLALTNAFLEILVACVGLSIILGAFGSTSRVTIPGQSIVLVGVAGVAVVLFILVIDKMDDRYVRVKIGGDVKNSQIDFVGDRSYLGAFQPSERTFDFIIFGKEIRRPVLALYITLPDKTEFLFECITQENVKPYLASGKTIEWFFDKEKAILLDTQGRQRIAVLGPCRENINQHRDDASSEIPPPSSLFHFISTALAQSDTAPTTQDIQTLVEQLESDSSYTRRDARSRLAEKGIQVTEPLLAKLADEHLTYRSRLGVIVALTEMMRANKKYRAEIIKRIKEEDLIRLIDSAADEDRTIRIYASEFLYDLGDPKAISLTFERFSSASEDGRYNLLLIIKGAVPFASDKQQNEVIEQVTKLKSEKTPKTNDLIDSIVDLVKKS
jgi:hypothetical protein